MVVVAIGISLPEELVRKIDIQRGDVTRSTYVRRLLEEAFEKRENKGVKK